MQLQKSGAEGDADNRSQLSTRHSIYFSFNDFQGLQRSVKQAATEFGFEMAPQQ
jgi:hypothetical protein